MLKRGITITNYLVDGNPEGVIFAYMSNWTGQAIKVPRNLFPNSKDYEEINKPGIYFLVGQSDENPDDKLVYIGEANNISERLVQHIRDENKSFFETIIAFSSKDENLTVSHTKYLEQRLIELLLKNAEYRTVNKKDGNKINLPKMVIDEMDTFLDNVKVLLPTLGFNLVENNGEMLTSKKEERDLALFLDVSNWKAKGKLTSNGLLVEKGSGCNPKETDSLSGSYSNLRRTLLEKEIVVTEGDRMIFADEYEFTSSSQAAAIILGYSVNGRVTWRNKNGETLKEIEERKLKEKNGG
ncbi:GIY-YIG nuclease family protein [Mariniphaga sediminis]|uniref:GIY-YIG nuclease family protein n=1 Tax=Mariniphaga sediminis TaxID=1628158 RepID=A0A399CXM0_9BACT|nr:GIY-YIG nuclease family protein [Mariniphaga sediminis]RIH64169.1 GIY-YIG nuclease family protein [Mariniphaga sediminis]